VLVLRGGLNNKMRTARVDTACSLRREGGAGDEAARCRAVSLHCARPAAAGSARLQSAVCRRRQGVVAAASSSETGGVRLSARQLKKALEAAVRARGSRSSESVINPTETLSLTPPRHRRC